MEPTIYEDALELGARRIAELRAILAPLLDEPADPLQHAVCVFCHQILRSDRGEAAHTSDCPVHRRDELLGRTPTAS